MLRKLYPVETIVKSEMVKEKSGLRVGKLKWLIPAKYPAELAVIIEKLATTPFVAVRWPTSTKLLLVA